MSNLEEAKKLRDNEGFTCALCKDGVSYTSTERGVLPLLMWIDEGLNLRGFSAADKIVGKAAAMLFALLGISEVHASIMSEAGCRELNRQGINGSCYVLVKKIVNRQETGQCPMEEAVREIEEPLLAIAAIKMRLLQ
jgi:hypothetical protein